MTHPDRRDFDTLEDYEDALELWYDYCDYKYDEYKDDQLMGNT